MIGDEDDPFTAEDWIKKAKENFEGCARPEQCWFTKQGVHGRRNGY